MDKLTFFRESMLDFVALVQRPDVAARLDAAIAVAKDADDAIRQFYIRALTDLLGIAQDPAAIAAATAVRTYWQEGTGIPEELAAAAWTAAETGGTLLGPDQKALDLITARAAARSLGIPSTDPKDAQHFGDGDGPEQALGNVGMLVALGMSKAPTHPEHASIQPATHTKSGKLDIADFTKTRAHLYSDMVVHYIDVAIGLL